MVFSVPGEAFDIADADIFSRSQPAECGFLEIFFWPFHGKLITFAHFVSLFRDGIRSKVW